MRNGEVSPDIAVLIGTIWVCLESRRKLRGNDDLQ